MKQYLRLASRLGLAATFAPMALGLVGLQAVVGPLTGNYEVLPKLVHKAMRKVYGYKVEFNAASAPLVKGKDQRVWYVVNHLSGADAFVIGGSVTGTFVGKGEIMKWPVIGQAVRSMKLMGIRRSSDYNDEARGKIAKNFNDGFNTIMFPEGTTGDGKQVHMFRAALMGLLYGEKAVDEKKNDVTLKEKVVVQPIAIRVKSVNGKDATNNDSLRNLYSVSNDGLTPLRRQWERLKVKKITLELTVLPPLDPANFNDAKELANQAALEVASIVNPGQTTFERKPIPVKTPKKAA